MRAGKGYTKSKLASFSLISLHPIDITSTIGRRLLQMKQITYLPMNQDKSEQTYRETEMIKLFQPQAPGF